MTWHLHELREPLLIDVTYDYQQKIQDIPDILEIGTTHVTGELHYTEGELMARLHIVSLPVLACAKTMKPVPYPMSFDVQMRFGDKEESDFILDDPFDLFEVVFGCVISEKPFVIYHPDAKDVRFEREKAPHPAFVDLEKKS